VCWVNRKIFWREYRALLRGHIGHFWAHIQQWKILPKAHCCIWAQKCLTWPLKRALYSLQKSSIFPPKELYIPSKRALYSLPKEPSIQEYRALLSVHSNTANHFPFRGFWKRGFEKILGQNHWNRTNLLPPSHTANHFTFLQWKILPKAHGCI